MCLGDEYRLVCTSTVSRLPQLMLTASNFIWITVGIVLTCTWLRIATLATLKSLHKSNSNGTMVFGDVLIGMIYVLPRLAP